MRACHQARQIDQDKWLLWVAPNPKQVSKIKVMTKDRVSRSLVLYPRNLEILPKALCLAIRSGNYESLTVPRVLISDPDSRILSRLADQLGVCLKWSEEHGHSMLFR